MTSLEDHADLVSKGLAAEGCEAHSSWEERWRERRNLFLHPPNIEPVRSQGTKGVISQRGQNKNQDHLVHDDVSEPMYARGRHRFNRPRLPRACVVVAQVRGRLRGRRRASWPSQSGSVWSVLAWPWLAAAWDGTGPRWKLARGGQNEGVSRGI